MGRDAGVATPNHQSAEGPATPTNFPAVEGSSDTPTSSRRQELVEAGSGGGGCCVSVYRESLFVTLVALGQDNIDLTAFDRSVSAFNKNYVGPVRPIIAILQSVLQNRPEPGHFDRSRLEGSAPGSGSNLKTNKNNSKRYSLRSIQH